MTERVEAYIRICFLILSMWHTLKMWMKGKQLGNCSRQLVKEIAAVCGMEVVLPVREAGEPKLRVVARLDDQVAQLLAGLDLELPTIPKLIANVVAKMGCSTIPALRPYKTDELGLAAEAFRRRWAGQMADDERLPAEAIDHRLWNEQQEGLQLNVMKHPVAL